MNESKADEYLTVAEIAGELKLNQQTIRNWTDQGSLRTVRVGPRRVRVLRSELDRMLGGEAAAPAAAEQTPADPLREIRQRLDPALQQARDALAAKYKHDLASALSALIDAAEQAIAALEQSASSPPPDTPDREPSDVAGPDAVSQRR